MVDGILGDTRFEEKNARAVFDFAISAFGGSRIPLGPLGGSKQIQPPSEISAVIASERIETCTWDTLTNSSALIYLLQPAALPSVWCKYMRHGPEKTSDPYAIWSLGFRVKGVDPKPSTLTMIFPYLPK